VVAGALTAGYFLLNVAYSRVLKNVAYVDVATIAAGFLIRVLVGAQVVAVPITHWLLACTFLLALLADLLARGRRPPPTSSSACTRPPRARPRATPTRWRAPASRCRCWQGCRCR
jgi:hypothetical protein